LQIKTTKKVAPVQDYKSRKKYQKKHPSNKHLKTSKYLPSNLRAVSNSIKRSVKEVFLPIFSPKYSTI